MGQLCLDFVVALAGFNWPELFATHLGHINESHSSPEKVSTVNFPAPLHTDWSKGV